MKKLHEALAIMREIFELAEGHEKQHNPFRNHAKLGNKTPKERKGADEKGDWECHKKGPYSQICKGVGPDTEGQTKVVHIDKAYKTKYNHDYKTGMASGKYKPAVRSGGGNAKKSKKKAS
jgi:hypothetical protein